MATPRIEYPFKPKSTAYLRTGQFWAVPLSDGRFACGYVVKTVPGRRRMFVAGLTNWLGNSPPEARDLVGCEVIDHAGAGLMTITEHGPEILGRCPQPLKVVPDERDHTWGYNVIRVLAEKRLREGRLSSRSSA